MTRKTEESYKAVFEYIHNNIIQLDGKAFMSDYEKAMRNALKKLFPNSKMDACWFHFTQAVKKNAAKYPAMMKLIRSNTDAAKIYYKLQALPLLPASEINAAFQMLKSQAPTKFKKFLVYYERQWLGSVIACCFYKNHH